MTFFAEFYGNIWIYVSVSFVKNSMMLNIQKPSVYAASRTTVIKRLINGEG
jgi:hypothetical protein